MESINCIICHKNETQLLVIKDSYNVVKCKRCGLVYLNPRLDENELFALYNLENHKETEVDDELSKGHDSHKIKKFKLAVSLIKKYKKNVQKIFDLGCSTGIFMGLAAEEGWNPFGSDVNRSLVDVNRKIYGEQVKLQEDMKIDFPERNFDVVTLFDSIEHMSDPVSILQEVSKVLKDDGMIIISTPNIDGLFPKITYWLLAKTIGAWEHPTPPGHVIQFSKETLRKVIEKAGFEMIDSQGFEIYRPYSIGEMENSIINKVRKSENTISQKGKANIVKEEKSALNNPERNSSLTQKTPRLIVRAFCRAMVSAIYPVAKMTDSGDTVVVIAKKKS